MPLDVVQVRGESEPLVPHRELRLQSARLVEPPRGVPGPQGAEHDPDGERDQPGREERRVHHFPVLGGQADDGAGQEREEHGPEDQRPSRPRCEVGRDDRHHRGGRHRPQPVVAHGERRHGRYGPGRARGDQPARGRSHPGVRARPGQEGQPPGEEHRARHHPDRQRGGGRAPGPAGDVVVEDPLPDEEELNADGHARHGPPRMAPEPGQPRPVGGLPVLRVLPVLPVRHPVIVAEAGGPCRHDRCHPRR